MSPGEPSPLSAMVGALARGLVDNPDQVEVKEESDGETRVISLYVAETDLGQVIGRGGRVARALLEFASETPEGEMLIRERISRQDIAKMVGASREMVSRVMKDLSLQGLIVEGGGQIVLREKINFV